MRRSDSLGIQRHTTRSTFLLGYFLGGLGAHRFSCGRNFSGLLYLFTGGLFGIGTFVDLLLILCGRFTDGAGHELEDNMPFWVSILLLVLYMLAFSVVTLIFISVAIVLLQNAALTAPLQPIH